MSGKIEKAKRLMDKTEGSLSMLLLQLEHLAEAFGVIGNRHMSDVLYNMRATVDDCVVGVSEARSLYVDEMLATAMENSRNVLNAALAGTEIERRTHEGEKTD